jgi:hypothetical protein
MKEYKNIDGLFKEGVSDFKVAPSEDLIRNVEAARLAAKRGSRKAVYFWTLALLLLLIGVSGWFFFGSQSNNDAVQQNQVVEEIISEEQIEKAPVEQTEAFDTHQITIMENTASPEKEETINESEPENIITAVYFDEEENNTIILHEKSIALHENVSIDEMQYRSIYEIAQMEPESIDPRSVKGMEEYLKKRSNIHFYTGLGATVAMAYYPSTTDQFTWSTDIAFGLKLHDFYIESGVGYQEMQERGIYQIDFKTHDSIGYYNEVVSFEINSQNPDEITYKTKQTTVYDSVEHYEHKTPLFKYSYLNIPLKLGYRFCQKNHFSVSAEAGVIFSKMLSKQIPEPTINNPDYELIAITNQTPERVDINFQWQVSLRLNYRFAKTMSVAVQPVFTKYINSIYDTKAGYPNVKPYTMGVRFGIYFDF